MRDRTGKGPGVPAGAPCGRTRSTTASSRLGDRSPARHASPSRNTRLPASSCHHAGPGHPGRHPARPGRRTRRLGGAAAARRRPRRRCAAAHAGHRRRHARLADHPDRSRLRPRRRRRGHPAPPRPDGTQSARRHRVNQQYSAGPRSTPAARPGHRCRTSCDHSAPTPSTSVPGHSCTTTTPTGAAPTHVLRPHARQGHPTGNAQGRRSTQFGIHAARIAAPCPATATHAALLCPPTRPPHLSPGPSPSLVLCATGAVPRRTARSE